MSIRLLFPVFLAGVLSPVDGSTLTLPAALEADLVNQGKAVWVMRPPLTRDSGVAVTAQTDPVTGVLLGAAVSGKVQQLDLYAKRAAAGLQLVAPPVSGLTSNAGANLTINSAGITTVNGESVYTVNATGAAGAANYFEVNVPLQSTAFAASDMTVEFICDDMSKIAGSLGLYLGTAGYAIFSTYSIAAQMTPSIQSSFAINGLTGYHVREALFSKSGYSDAMGNQSWVNCKIRVYVTDGQTLTFSLRSITVGANRRKGRIAIVSDDGYDSWHRLGVPLLREFGFKSTNAIIYDTVGTSDKASLATLQAYVAEGNECVAHGPNDGTGGTGNLWTTWTTDAQRIADVNACRDYLKNNKLCSDWGARSYVWPQGRFCTSTTDYAMLALMQANGYTVARSANAPSTMFAHRNNALSSLNLASLATPIIGHTWTSTPTEVTNIPAICAKVAAVAAARMDCSLMLHRVVGVDAAAQSTEISANRLREIMAAIQVEVDAGTLDVVLYSEFAK